MPTSLLEPAPLMSNGKPIVAKRRARTWTNTAGYWTVPKDQLPINPYDDNQIEATQSLGIAKTWSKSTGALSSTTFVGYNTYADLMVRHGNLSTWLSQVERSDQVYFNEAMIKALNKVGEAKINLAVTGKEASKTSTLILGKAKSVYEAYRDFRRGNFKGVAQHLNISPKKAHKSWLEYRYGWMPLLSDVKNAAEFLAQQSFGRRQAFTVVGKHEVSSTRTQHVKDPSYSPGSNWTEWAARYRTYRVKIWAEIENQSLTEAQQLGLTNPASFAWEVIPFSFVFDWFVGVGDWLQAQSSLQGIVVKRAMQSREAILHTTYESVALGFDSAPGSPGSGVINSGYVFRFGSMGRSYYRAPVVVDPLRTWPPIKDNPMNLVRLTSGLALIRAQGRRLG